MSDWLLCPAAHAEAERTGLVYRCEGRANHTCDGPRTPYLWKAVDRDGRPFDSEEPHCASCRADEEEGYGLIWDEACCCAHAGGPGRHRARLRLPRGKV